MNIYLEAFGIFFKIGAFTIGGGYAMVPLIENEIVTKRNWISKDDFIDLLAIAQSAPGILAVNISIIYRIQATQAYGEALSPLLERYFRHSSSYWPLLCFFITSKTTPL